MLRISLAKTSLLETSADLIVVGQFQGSRALSPTLVELNQAMEGRLEEWMEAQSFSGKMGEWTLLPTFGTIKAKRIGVIGLGEKNEWNVDAARKAGAMIIRRGRESKVARIVTTLPGVGASEASVRDLAQAFAEGVWLGAYRFHAYKGKMSQEDVQKPEVKEVIIAEVERAKLNQVERGIAEARVLAEATMLARDLVNTPSADMAPQDLASVAKKIVAGKKGLSLKILDASQMKALGMEAALAVAKGSDHPPVGVHLIYSPPYKGGGKAKKRIAIIGKAVTFDSGGLSIKTADGMMTMKIDMAGAAAVLGLFQALPSFAPNVEVHGIFLAVENMPSGRAYRPGDVVKAMNGNTIEVLNTDAEGRVTLADALSYAATLKPDAIIDLATLTGACVVALGEEVAGLMSNDAKLTDRLLHAAQDAGEELWQLPLFKPYQELIKSKVADIKNTGGRAAGTITAALFLSHFVGDIPWAHLDIAGPSYAEKETRPDVPFGGTGYGVRLLMRYLQAVG